MDGKKCQWPFHSNFHFYFEIDSQRAKYMVSCCLQGRVRSANCHQVQVDTKWSQSILNVVAKCMPSNQHVRRSYGKVFPCGPKWVTKQKWQKKGSSQVVQSSPKVARKQCPSSPEVVLKYSHNRPKQCLNIPQVCREKSPRSPSLIVVTMRHHLFLIDQEVFSKWCQNVFTQENLPEYLKKVFDGIAFLSPPKQLSFGKSTRAKMNAFIARNKNLSKALLLWFCTMINVFILLRENIHGKTYSIEM